MKKNKKLLVSFLALNAMASSYAPASGISSAKYDRMYNSIVKNMETSKSNEKTYQTIEKILKQKNKELKDLYLQNDYIVKPEYLEWQVFFAGFYDEYNEGRDNSSENALYHSKVTGYYDTTGSHIVTSGFKDGTAGKPYKELQQPKEINLGVNIPINVTNRNFSDFNVKPNSGPTVSGSFNTVIIPSPSLTPLVSMSKFQPAELDVNITPPFSVPQLSFQVTGFIQGTSSAFRTTTTSDVMIDNYKEVIADSLTTLITGPGGSFSGNIRYGNGALTTWNSTVARTGVPPALYSSVINQSVTIKGDWQIDHTIAGQTRFVSYNPYAISTTQYLDFSGNLELNNTGGGYLIGLEHQILAGFSSPIPSTTYSMLINSGNIYLNNGTQMIGITLEKEFAYGDFGTPSQTYNLGKIILGSNSSNSIGIDFGAYNDGPLNSDMYTGDIEINGTENYGVRVYDIFSSSQNYFDNVRIHGEKSDSGKYGAGGDGLINIKGNKNIGLSLSKKIGAVGYVDNISNLNLRVDGEQNVGILRNSSFAVLQTNDIELTGTQIKSLTYGDDSIDSILVRSDRYTTIIDASVGARIGSYDTGVTTLGGVITNGIDNILFMANGTGQSASQVGKIVNNADITITNTAKNAKGLVAYNGGWVTNSGVIINNSERVKPIGSNDAGAVGMSVLGSASQGTNSSSGKLLLQNTSTNLSAGVYNEGTFVNAGEIEVYGDKGIGVYSKGAATNTTLSNKLTVSGDNSIALFSDGAASSNFKIGGLVLSVSGTDAYAFYSKNGGGYSITGNTAVNVGAGSIGFQYVGSGLNAPINPADITNMFNSAGGTLTFNLNPNSYAMVIQNAKINISDLGTFTSIMPAHVVMSGSDKAKVYKGHLEIDEDSSIDSGAVTNVKYRDLLVASSRITLGSGKTLSGTEAGLIGIGQENDSIAGITNTDMSMTNNGTIVLNGVNSTGMYASYGSLNNAAAGIIKVSDNGVGLYGTNGTITENYGKIEFGDNGIGVYGTNITPGSTPTYGTKNISVTNFDSIKSTGINKAYGIVADNDNSGSSHITLNSGSIIDLSSVTNALAGDLVGVYAKNTILNSAGDITVGKNGIAVYAEDSNVTLTGGTINITGDNALGFYLKGSTDFSAAAGTTVNVSGQGVTIFNLNTNPGMIFNNLMTINTSGSGTYTLGSIANGTYYYNDSVALSGNGAMISAKNSMVLFDGGANISTTGNNNIGIYVDGIYTLPVLPGFTAGIEAENRGTITLNNSSAGLYAIGGTSAYNNGGVISVGNDSTAIYATGSTSNALNSGTLIIGSDSQGIYLKDGQTADNSGMILSSGNRTVGIYTDNVVNPIVNNNLIDLSGNKSIGIYAVGPAKTLINNGTVKIGDSSDVNDPGIGIYTAAPGDIITNNGIIDTGNKSIGIYAEGAAVNQSGTFVIGETGTGIYTKGGIVTLGAGSTISVGQNEAIGVYGTNGTAIHNNSANLSVGNGGYGFVLETNSTLNNNNIINLNGKGTGVYSDGANTVISAPGADINITGDNNIGYFLVNGGTVTNSADINGSSGKSNIGIYAKNGIINNSGIINTGDSVLRYNSDGTIDYDNSGYAVGIYGDGSQINNTGTINIKENGIGIYTRDNTIPVVNQGNINGTGKGATGLFVDNGVIENALGITITISGDDSIGMAANKNGTIINNGNIIMSGNNVTGMFANISSKAVNNGLIDMSGTTGNKSTAFLLGAGSTYENNGTLILGSNATISSVIGISHEIPSLINGGIIQSDGVLAADGISLSIKVNPESVVYQTSVSSGPQFVANGASIVADTLITDKPIIILPGFADGTNANVYKIENAVIASGGNYEFISGSLLWEATPEATGTGANVYMARKAFTDFTDGLWFEDFGTALEENFLGASGDAMQIYNKTAYIKTEEEFRQLMSSLAGDVYANINQREYDVAKAFEDSLHLLQDSANNTKENVKISVIAGKGKNKEETDGVTGYDYAMTGVIALREVERTYRHTFGYSLGYLHTGFEFKDGNESEEWVDTIQLGVHNKYAANGWQLRNDLTGRASIHNIDRNIDWPSPLGRSEMNGTYETYSITSDNILGKAFGLGKNASIMPYGAFRAMYVTRPAFNENGLEALEVEGNDAWSAKPRAGVELKGMMPLGNRTAWQLKGTLDFAYEYELSDLYEREKARLTAIEDGYHKLAKPQDEKGTFRTKAAIGVEIEDRYGIFLTGEYSTGNDKENDYRAGVILKAVF